jgi:hypothetical protein
MHYSSSQIFQHIFYYLINRILEEHNAQVNSPDLAQSEQEAGAGNYIL